MARDIAPRLGRIRAQPGRDATLALGARFLELTGRAGRDDQGHVVTNFHVIRNADGGAQVALWDQSPWKARVIGAFPDKDLAVLKIDGPKDKLVPIPVGRSDDLQVGQKVFAIGNPFGLDQTLTNGIISALGREIESVNKRPIKNMIQTNADIVSGDSGGPNSYTTLATTPVSQEEPYLYTDASGNYNVFVPSAQTNSNGPTWTNGNTPGTSLGLNTFYVVNSASTIGNINGALSAGDNLLFTPGVYSYNQTINVTKADTKIIGLGFATLVPSAGQTTINVADVGEHRAAAL